MFQCHLRVLQPSKKRARKPAGAPSTIHNTGCIAVSSLLYQHIPARMRGADVRILMQEVRQMSEHWKRSNRPIDDMETVASANEWTGMLPAMPADEDTQPVRRMMNVHPQPKPGKFRPTDN